VDLELDQLQRDIISLYNHEHQALGDHGTYEILDKGRQWVLCNTLNDGGVLVFPHAGVVDCGYQIAAVVHACLDSGADRVLIISVLHAFTEEMEDARIRVAYGEVPSKFKCWGIQGPGIPGRNEWRSDHVLMSFRHFWAAEIKRRGIQGPELIERYPYLAGGHPERLPGMDKLERLAKDSVIISTADPFHHGIGYGDLAEKSLFPNHGGLDLARKKIEEGIKILAKGDYWGYNQHCVMAKSDARDAGQVFRYLRGEMKGQILDLTYSDAADLYQQPDPTWVAAALIEWQL